MLQNEGRISAEDQSPVFVLLHDERPVLLLCSHAGLLGVHVVIAVVIARVCAARLALQPLV